jgi:hypothetical protein
MTHRTFPLLMLIYVREIVQTTTCSPLLVWLAPVQPFAASSPALTEPQLVALLKTPLTMQASVKEMPPPGLPPRSNGSRAASDAGREYNQGRSDVYPHHEHSEGESSSTKRAI